MRNLYQAWTWSSLPSMSKISIMSSLASKNFKNPTLWGIFANGLTFHFKIPHNAGFKKFLKDSSQCWIYPGKNPTLWGIFVKLELNHHWHQCQRSQWCHQKLQRFPKIKLCEEYLKNDLFLQLKIPHNAGFKKFLKNSSQCWIHSGKNPAFLTPPPIFFNWWSWCISKFLTMQDS